VRGLSLLVGNMQPKAAMHACPIGPVSCSQGSPLIATRHPGAVDGGNWCMSIEMLEAYSPAVDRMWPRVHTRGHIAISEVSWLD